MRGSKHIFKVAPGLGLCCAISVLIIGATNQIAETILDTLLIALLFGIVFKNIFPKAQWHNAGAKFAAKPILEFSVMLLGASIVFTQVVSAGPWLFALITCGVAGSMLIAFFVGHILLKLSPNLAILIGVSNSICGNAAAMAMAPIIRASSAELTSAIAISGLLGATQIILLPLLVPVFGLSEHHYGIVAGMAVYAVAQVYAASSAVSATSASVATFVKLVRVTLLAPVIIVVQMFFAPNDSGSSTNLDTGSRKISFRKTSIQYIPWFVIGFMALATLRSIGIIGEAEGSSILEFSSYSFVIAMVAIGMSVDIRDILNVGIKVAVTICSVILFMVMISILAGSFLPLTGI